MRFGFSYIGLIWLIMLFVPNIVFVHRLDMADHAVCPQYCMDKEQAAGL